MEAQLKRVLIIDDDQLIRQMLVEALEDEGYAVAAYADGQQGVEALERGPLPDIILLDLMLPVLDGWGVLRARAARSDWAAIPVLVLSAALPSGLKAAKELGAAYVHKPFDVEALLLLVEQFTHVAQERARLEGVLLAARTAQHALNNTLALTVGYAEMVARDPRLPDDLRQHSMAALQSAEQASALLTDLGRVTRLDEVDIGAPGGPVLNLPRKAHSRG